MNKGQGMKIKLLRTYAVMNDMSRITSLSVDGTIVQFGRYSTQQNGGAIMTDPLDYLSDQLRGHFGHFKILSHRIGVPSSLACAGVNIMANFQHHILRLVCKYVT